MIQDILAESVTQHYPIGLRLPKDIRVFRYIQAAEALAGLARLVINSNYAPGVTGHLNEDGFEGAGGVNAYAAPIGQKYLDIKDTALRAAEFYQGGMAVIFGVLIFHQHYIVRSEAGNGTYVRLWLGQPIAVEDITAAMGCTAYRNPYTAVKKPGSTQTGFETFLGVPLIPVTLNYFAWIQTKGPAWVTPTGVTWPGSAANLRDVYANAVDGTLQPATISDPSAGFQRIGTLIGVTGGTASDYGDAMINLDLDPS